MHNRWLTTVQIALTLIVLSTTVSCIRASMQPIQPNLPPAKSPHCQLDIYLNGSQELGEIEKLCFINSIEPDMPWRRTKPHRVIERAFDLACTCGAQGVLINEYSGTQLDLLAFTYSQKKPKLSPSGITLSHFKDLMNCRYSRGVWANNKCSHAPSRSARERDNMRQ